LNFTDIIFLSLTRNFEDYFILFQRIDEMNLEPFKTGGMNITGFQLLNYSKLQSDKTKIMWQEWQWPDIKDAAKIPVPFHLSF